MWVKRYLFCLSILLFTLHNVVGQILVGEIISNRFIQSASISGNGNKMAYGYIEVSNGTIKIFDIRSNGLVNTSQISSDSVNFATEISLSQTGNSMLVNSSSLLFKNHAVIFQQNEGGIWTQMTNVIQLDSPLFNYNFTKMNDTGDRFVTIHSYLDSKNNEEVHVYGVIGDSIKLVHQAPRLFPTTLRLHHKVDFDNSGRNVVLSKEPIYFPFDAKDDINYLVEFNDNGGFRKTKFVNNSCEGEIKNSSISITDDGNRVVVFECGHTMTIYQRGTDDLFRLKSSTRILDSIYYYPNDPCEMVLSDDGRHAIIYNSCTREDPLEVMSFYYDEAQDQWREIARDYVQNIPDGHIIFDVEVSDEGKRVLFHLVPYVSNFFDSTFVQVFEFSFGDINSTVSESEEKISLYPNPVDDVLHVRGMSPGINAARVFIYDIAGIKRIEAPFRGPIDVSSLPAGMYILQVYDDNKLLASSKLVKGR